MADNTFTDGDIDIGIPGNAVSGPNPDGLIEVINPGVALDAGTPVIFDSIGADEPTNIAESTDAFSQPKGQRLALGFVSGTGVAQVTSGFIIKRRAQFSADLHGVGSNQNWVVTQASPAYTKDGETKQSISFRKMLGALQAP